MFIFRNCNARHRRVAPLYLTILKNFITIEITRHGAAGMRRLFDVPVSCHDVHSLFGIFQWRDFSHDT